MENVLQELFWAYFFGCPYRSNGTKIHLEAALLIPKSLKRFLGTIYIVFTTFRNFSIWMFDFQSTILYLVFVFRINMFQM